MSYSDFNVNPIDDQGPWEDMAYNRQWKPNNQLGAAIQAVNNTLTDSNVGGSSVGYKFNGRFSRLTSAKLPY